MPENRLPVFKLSDLIITVSAGIVTKIYMIQHKIRGPIIMQFIATMSTADSRFFPHNKGIVS